MTKEKRCHPELVSGSRYSIYPLVFVCKIYEMPKQVRHDSLVWVRWGKKVEKYTRCRNKFGMTFKKRGDIPTSTPHPQQKPPWFSPSPDAYASPLPSRERRKKAAQGKGRGKRLRAAWVFKGGKKPPTSHRPIIFTLTRRLRVPLSPQGRGNFGYPHQTVPLHTKLSCRINIKLSC